jgi:hypothetical protein
MNKELKVVSVSDMGVRMAELGFNVTKEVISLGQAVNYLKNGGFKCNDPLQRQHVWNLEKKSLLVVSGIEGINIGEIKAEIIRENNKKRRNILDGKQRFLTLTHYKMDKWATAKGTYVRGYNEQGELILIDISGLKFSELPEEMQEKLNSVQFTIECYENLTPEIKNELFFRWNNGEPLKPTEKRKTKMTEELREVIDKLRTKKPFQVGLTASVLNRDGDSETVQQALAILATNGDTAIGSKALDEMVENNVFTPEVIDELTIITEYLEKVVDEFEEAEYKEVFKKTKVTAMVIPARVAIKRGISPQLFSDWVSEFFRTDDFKQYAKGSTSSKDIIKKRINVTLNNFAKVHNIILDDETLTPIQSETKEVAPVEESQPEQSKQSVEDFQDEQVEQGVQATENGAVEGQQSEEEESEKVSA